MDDDEEDDEDEEDEEAFVDDEASDEQWADADGMGAFAWEGGAPPAGASRWTTMHMQDGFFDEPLGGLRMDFGRMPGGSRRLMGGRLADRPPAAAAGVWDDTGDAMDALPDPMMTGEAE
jgi:hypothetical protein